MVNMGINKYLSAFASDLRDVLHLVNIPESYFTDIFYLDYNLVKSSLWRRGEINRIERRKLNSWKSEICENRLLQPTQQKYNITVFIRLKKIIGKCLFIH